jgi:cytochrome c553
MSTACIWLPEYLTPVQPFGAPQSGTGAHSWPVRLAVVAACAWASTGWLTALAARQRLHLRPYGAVAALGVMACVTANASWLAHLGPWALRGQVYANGLHVSDVTAHRRSPFLVAGQTETAGHEVAVHMARSQCAPCHGSAPGDLTARLSKRNQAEARELLETLREADRFGNPFLQRMPPLLGSDEEVDALAAWLVRH